MAPEKFPNSCVEGFWLLDVRQIRPLTTTSSAPGIDLAKRSAIDGGVAASFSPTITRVGALM